MSLGNAGSFARGVSHFEGLVQRKLRMSLKHVPHGRRTQLAQRSRGGCSAVTSSLSPGEASCSVAPGSVWRGAKGVAGHEWVVAGGCRVAGPPGSLPPPTSPGSSCPPLSPLEAPRLLSGESKPAGLLLGGHRAHGG